MRTGAAGKEGACAAWSSTALILAFGSAAAAQSTTLDIEFESFTLGNGLRVILHRDASTPTTATNIWYHFGSGRERAGRIGFVNRFEHIVFEGSGTCWPIPSSITARHRRLFRRCGRADRRNGTGAHRVREGARRHPPGDSRRGAGARPQLPGDALSGRLPVGGAVAARVGELVQYDLPDATFDRYVGSVPGVTADGALEAALGEIHVLSVEDVLGPVPVRTGT